MSIKIKATAKKAYQLKREMLCEKYKGKPLFQPITYDDYDKLPKYIFDRSVMPYRNGIHKVFRKNERRINENIIQYPKTLSFKEVAEHVFYDVFRGNDALKIEHGNHDTLDENGVYGHICFIIQQRHIFNGMPEHLIELMHAAGYYLAYKTSLEKPNDNNYFMWQFEPYYYMKIRETVEPLIFHVTKVELLGNICKYGLIAQRNNDQLLIYPPRNYFFNGPYRTNFISYAITGNKLNNDNQFGVCTIDVNKLPLNIEFFTDSNYIGKQGIYTYSDIPNNVIVNTTIETI